MSGTKSDPPITTERAVLAVALAIAVQTPLRRTNNTMEAKVNWRLIYDLREALEQDGWDLDEARKANFDVYPPRSAAGRKLYGLEP